MDQLFTLLNKTNNQQLRHPRLGGVWYTKDRQEAEEMLREWQELLIDLSLPHIASQIVIVDLETGEEI